MARGINKVTLLGNVGNDPEFRTMPNGTGVVNFSLATSEQWTDKQTQQKQERTEWHRCQAFARLSETIRDYVKKGDKIYIEGSIHTRKYQQDGQDRYTTEIKVNELLMLSNRPENANNGQQAAPQQAPQQGGQQPAPQQGQQQYDDDIPF